MLGQGDAGGPAWVSSPLADLQVVQPFVGVKIARTPVEQGQATQVKVALDQKNPFDGKAKIELLGLPNAVTTEAKEITSADKEVVFDVKTDAKSPAGNHNSLFCRITVMKDGEPVIENVGQGGVLRIDAPRDAKKDAAKPNAANDKKDKK